MSRTMRALICLMMSMMMILTMNVWGCSAVSAEETSVQPRYNYTGYTSTSLSITTAGTARCFADAEGYQDIVTKVHIEMKLQQYLALQWTTVGVWTGTFNDYYGALSKTKTLTSSGNYRVKAVFTVYSGSNSEKITSYSPERYYTRP